MRLDFKLAKVVPGVTGNMYIKPARINDMNNDDDNQNSNIKILPTQQSAHKPVIQMKMLI